MDRREVLLGFDDFERLLCDYRCQSNETWHLSMDRNTFTVYVWEGFFWTSFADIYLFIFYFGYVFPFGWIFILLSKYSQNEKIHSYASFALDHIKAVFDFEFWLFLAGCRGYTKYRRC